MSRGKNKIVSNVSQKMRKTIDAQQSKAIQDSAVKTTDGFNNFITRTGIGAANTQTAGTYTPNLLTRNRLKLEWMYRGSWLCGKIVDDYASDMTRAGIKINSPDNPDDIQKIEQEMTRLKIWSAIASNIKWGRLYGGSVAIIDIEGQDLSTPLDVRTIRKGQFRSLIVMDRWMIYPDLTRMIPNGPQAGLPMFYQIASGQDITSVGGGMEIQASGPYVHYSRVIRSIGIELPYFQAITEMMWGESVIERLNDRLISFDAGTMGATNLLNKAYLRTIKVDQLRSILAAGGEAEASLLKQFDMIRYMQNVEGLTLIDKEDESSTTSYSFAGMSDILLQFGQQLSGACGIPLVRLFGQAPAGLNATGESDIRMYYDSINAAQNSMLRDGLQTILQCIYQSLFQKPMPESLTFDFNPLWQTSAKEKADIAKTLTDAISEAYTADIIDKPTAMRELQAITEDCGVYSNITEDLITEAENEPPPPPVENMPLPPMATGKPTQLEPPPGDSA